MTSPSIDPERFKAFELAAWGDHEVAAAYSSAFLNVTSQAAPSLLDGAGVRQGTKVLDVATGPGVVAAAAAERGGEATGIDFSAEMVALARRNHPGVRFEE